MGHGANTEPIQNVYLTPAIAHGVLTITARTSTVFCVSERREIYCIVRELGRSRVTCVGLDTQLLRCASRSVSRRGG
jgi:hypothetical protein